MTTFDDQFKSVFMVDDLDECPAEMALEIAERRVTPRKLSEIKPSQTASGFNVNWSDSEKDIRNIHALKVGCKTMSKDDLDKLLIGS